jgi:NADH-quinone oxidoreductase subunit J
MIVQAVAFYLFAAICVASGVMVISARNPVHSVLFLILAFFNAAGLFVLMGAEFLAMILVVVYVGAVAVLFLFVVMMLDIDFVELRRGALQHLPVAGIVGLILLVELVFLAITNPLGGTGEATAAPPAAAEISNTLTIGRVLYTDYILLFQGAGLILLVAMIGAIVLTHRSRAGVRKQVIASQIGRRRELTVEVRKVRSREGVSS